MLIGYREGYSQAPAVPAVMLAMEGVCLQKAEGWGHADLLLGLSKVPDLRRSMAGCRGAAGSREELAGEPPAGSRVNACRLRELVGDSMTWHARHATSASAAVHAPPCRVPLPRREIQVPAITRCAYTV